MKDINITDAIKNEAINILDNEKNGLKLKSIIDKISNKYRDYNIRTIRNSIWDLDIKFPNKVYKPERAIFKSLKYKDDRDDLLQTNNDDKITRDIKEEAFYEPFAKWLVEDVGECTKAIPFGGNKFKEKWSTPDVIGKYQPMPSDIIRHSIKIVCAEIKINTDRLIEAFGQSCSYCLFSDKVYLVIPKDSGDDVIDRIESLCLIKGIGLVLFDTKNIDDPDFEIRTRPRFNEPDPYYLNLYMKKVEKELFA